MRLNPNNRKLNNEHTWSNHLCKAGIKMSISRKICKNNCNQWDNKKRKCKQGY